LFIRIKSIGVAYRQLNPKRGIHRFSLDKRGRKPREFYLISLTGKLLPLVEMLRFRICTIHKILPIQSFIFTKRKGIYP
jgi:hypothetical protein